MGKQRLREYGAVEWKNEPGTRDGWFFPMLVGQHGRPGHLFQRVWQESRQAPENRIEQVSRRRADIQAFESTQLPQPEIGFPELWLFSHTNPAAYS